MWFEFFMSFLLQRAKLRFWKNFEFHIFTSSMSMRLIWIDIEWMETSFLSGLALHSSVFFSNKVVRRLFFELILDGKGVCICATVWKSESEKWTVKVKGMEGAFVSVRWCAKVKVKSGQWKVKNEKWKGWNGRLYLRDGVEKWKWKVKNEKWKWKGWKGRLYLRDGVERPHKGSEWSHKRISMDLGEKSHHAAQIMKYQILIRNHSALRRHKKSWGKKYLSLSLSLSSEKVLCFFLWRFINFLVWYFSQLFLNKPWAVGARMVPEMQVCFL